eukprot:scaffold32958_cov50-Phaeocystis_antarctica.AAC.3
MRSMRHATCHIYATWRRGCALFSAALATSSAPLTLAILTTATLTTAPCPPPPSPPPPDRQSSLRLRRAAASGRRALSEARLTRVSSRPAWDPVY